MITLPSSVRVFVCTLPTDMRKGFNGLGAMAAEVMSQNPLSGNLFVFRNKRGNRLKILYWDGDGLALWYKALESGTFELPQADQTSVEVTSSELSMLIGGIDLSTKRRKRFKLPRAA